MAGKEPFPVTMSFYVVTQARARLAGKRSCQSFLKGKTQLDAEELVETRRVASLRIHVERAMERIKNYHIFDRTLPSSLNDVAEETFFVCAVMCNYWPPLCL